MNINDIREHLLGDGRDKDRVRMQAGAGKRANTVPVPALQAADRDLLEARC
jgi:hypothetical protein